MQSDQWPRPDEPGREDGEVRAAVRFALLSAGAGVAFVAIAALVASDCDRSGSTDTVTCGPVSRILLGSGAPLILLVCGLAALFRTYLNWRRRKPWWAWQGAGWFLLTLMLITLTVGFGPIAGPVLGGSP